MNVIRDYACILLNAHVSIHPLNPVLNNRSVFFYHLYITKIQLNSTHFKRKFSTFLYRLSLAFSDFFILYGKYDSFLDYLL